MKVKRKPRAHPGNKHAIKIKDKGDRWQAFQAYLLHIESGFPKEAFSYSDEKGNTCCHKTIERYIEENPTEFPPILIQMAMAKRFKLWFEIGMKMVRGSPVIWQTIMRNMFRDYGWDKDETKQSSFTPEQEATLKSLFELMATRQEEVKKKKE